MLRPTPTDDHALPRLHSEFNTLTEAVDYAAKGQRGINFYSARGELLTSLTYRELRERAIATAQRFIRLGLNKGERVVIIANTTEDFVILFIGCQYASLLPVPLPMPTTFGGRENYTEQLNRQMKSCGASAAVSPPELMEFLSEAAADLSLKFIGTAAQLNALPEGGFDLRLPGADDLCYLQYSSGSTRFPHGVSVTQRSLTTNCREISKYGVVMCEGDRTVSWLPFYHDMGLVGMLCTPLTCQVSADFLSTEDFTRRPLQWLSLITQNRGTISFSPTFGFELCARRAGADAVANLDLSSWRVAGIGGDMIRPDVMAKFTETFQAAGYRGESFVPSYGLAECTLAVSFAGLNKGLTVDLVDENALADENQAVPVTQDQAMNRRVRPVVDCGKVLPSLSIEIRSEDSRCVEDRQVGRIFVKGDSVMRGYYADPEATIQAMPGDGWLNTGDMGYRIGESIFIVGRAKDLIIVNGRNHWPQDIEWAVEQLPGLRSGDSGAIAIPDGRNGETAAILVQCRLRDAQEQLNLINEVEGVVRRLIGITCKVILVPPRALPRTSSGKLSRSRARTQYLNGTLVPVQETQTPLAAHPVPSAQAGSS